MVSNIFDDDVVKSFSEIQNKIKSAIDSRSSSYIDISFYMHKIHADGLFVLAGYNNFSKYSSDVFGFKKTQSYSFVKVVERFACRDDDGAVLPELLDRWKSFDFSKLSLMAALTDQELDSSGFTPDMSVRDIKRNIKMILSERSENQNLTDTSTFSERSEKKVKKFEKKYSSLEDSWQDDVKNYFSDFYKYNELNFKVTVEVLN